MMTPTLSAFVADVVDAGGAVEVHAVARSAVAAMTTPAGIARLPLRFLLCDRCMWCSSLITGSRRPVNAVVLAPAKTTTSKILVWQIVKRTQLSACSQGTRTEYRNEDARAPACTVPESGLFHCGRVLRRGGEGLTTCRVQGPVCPRAVTTSS